MYVQLALDTSGFGESRITARTTPRTIPIAMASTVSSIVARTACRIWCEKRYWRTTSHWNRGFVATELMIAAATSTMTAAPTPRPGGPTGIALISSGRTGCAVSTVVIALPLYLADGAIDLRVGDGAGRDVPLLEDRGVGPALHQGLHRREHGRGHTVPLWDGDAV